MAQTTATRPTDELHEALATANASARLAAFTSATGCAPDEVLGDDGKSIDLLRVFDAMRARGYQVSTPVRPQEQTKPGYTAWKVSIGVTGANFKLVFFTPNNTASSLKEHS